MIGDELPSGHSGVHVVTVAEHAALRRRVEELEEIVHSLSRPRVWMDKRQAADYTSLGLSTIEKKTAAREIPFHRMDGRNLYRVDELDEWLTLRVPSVSTSSNGRAPRQRPRPGTRRLSPDATRA